DDGGIERCALARVRVRGVVRGLDAQPARAAGERSASSQTLRGLPADRARAEPPPRQALSPRAAALPGLCLLALRALARELGGRGQYRRRGACPRPGLGCAPARAR